MYLTIDTSALISVIGNERSKPKIIALSKGYSLHAPSSVHWEVGNAFSAMFKRRSMDIESAQIAIQAYDAIPIRFVDVALATVIELSHRLDIYAYDAYLIQCALQTSTPLLTLDRRLAERAKSIGIHCFEIQR